MDGAWVFNATKRQQRKARNGESFPRPTARSLLDPSWSVPSAGDRVALTHLFAVLQEVSSGDTSYIQILNRAGGMIVSPIRVPVPIVSNVPTTSYDLTAYASFLDRQERFGWPDGTDGNPQPKLLEPHPLGQNPVPADWRRPRLRIDGPSVWLDLDVPFAIGTTGNLSLNLMVPAVNWVKPAGGASYGVSLNGLVSDGDEVLPDVNDLVEVALLEAIQRGHLGEGHSHRHGPLERPADGAVRQGAERPLLRREPVQARQPCGPDGRAGSDTGVSVARPAGCGGAVGDAAGEVGGQADYGRSAANRPRRADWRARPRASPAWTT